MKVFPGVYKKIGLVLVLIWMLPAAIDAQDASMNMEILREKVLADRKLIVAEAMALTDTEAEAFWPVYDRYVKELGEIGARYARVIEDYADNYRTMNDAKAKAILDEYMACEARRLKLQQDFLPEFRKAIPEIKVTRFYQIENKIRAATAYELAGAIPLMK